VTELKSESKLEKLLSRGEFVVTGELGPPKSVDLAVLEAKVAALSGAVDSVNITDNQTAIVRISSIGTAFFVLAKGLEPVVQMTCRDRNRLAIQADLLGAYLNGLRNLLCLTGDHQSFGNHPQAKQVYDLDSVQLIQMVKQMRDEKVFQCGEEIRNSKKSELHEPRFFIGAAANPFAEPTEWRVIRLQKKAAAGVDFVQTQCVYDMDLFEHWMEEVVSRGLHKKVKILAGITPVRSLGMLKYMKSSVAGVLVPDALVKRFEDAADVKAEGKQFALEQIERFRKMPGVAGVHIMAIEAEATVRGIVQEAGLLPRPQVA
jgi:methylenetetrahydrofolate reductase (NADPH)